MKTMTPFYHADIELMVLPINEESYSIGSEMPNPEGVKATRMHLLFSASNETFIADYTDNEDADQGAFVQLGIPATAYGDDSDIEAGFIEGVIKHLTAYRDAFNAEQDALVAENASHVRQNPGLNDCDLGIEISDLMVAEYVKKVTPERTGFALDELPLIGEYKQLCYNTSKWISCVLTGCKYHLFYSESGAEGELIETLPLFDTIDDIVSFLTKHLEALKD